MANLFSDPRHSVADQVLRAYEHKDQWVNRMMLGDSLVAMNSLLRYESLGGQVQMIYMDPPYGVKFGSNWQVSTRKRDVKDGKAEDATRQPEQIRAFRDTWKLGIHSYLAYLRDRLTAARELLTESGSVFVQIGEIACVVWIVYGEKAVRCPRCSGHTRSAPIHCVRKRLIINVHSHPIIFQEKSAGLGDFALPQDGDEK